MDPAPVVRYRGYALMLRPDRTGVYYVMPGEPLNWTFVCTAKDEQVAKEMIDQWHTAP